MKTIITQLAKGLIVILYLALVVLFVWLFYDDYLTEGNRLSIFMCVAFFSLGCALKPLFISWIYEKELQDFCQRHTMFYDRLKKVIWIYVWIFGVIAVASGIIGIGLIRMISIFVYGLVKIIIYSWEWWLGLLIAFIISFVLKAFKSPIARIIRKLIYRLSLLLTAGLVIYIEISYVGKYLGEDSMEATSIGYCGVLLLAVLGVSLYLFYKSLQKGVFTFAVSKYVLFLRAFKSDDTILYDRIAKSIDKIPLMKIGNPNKEESEDISEHWLPLSTWKIFLKFYISRAKAVVVVISLTDGVIWEVVQNVKNLNKCIIHFASLDELEYFKDRLLLLKNGSLDLIIRAIENIIASGAPEKSFIVNNDKIYLGDVCNLINAVLENDFSNLKWIDIVANNTLKTNKQLNKLVVSVRNFLFRQFHFLNFINILETIHNATLRGILTIFAYILATIVIMGYCLFTLLMILMPLIVWFNQDEYFQELPIVVKVILPIFFCSLGINRLREYYRKR